MGEAGSGRDVEAPRPPLPAIVHVEATVFAMLSLQAVLHAVNDLLRESSDVMGAVMALALASLFAWVAAGLWRGWPPAWRWAVASVALVLGSWLAWPLIAGRHLPEGWDYGAWYGWPGLQSQLQELILLVLLLLPASRRPLARTRATPSA